MSGEQSQLPSGLGSAHPVRSPSHDQAPGSVVRAPIETRRGAVIVTRKSLFGKQKSVSLRAVRSVFVGLVALAAACGASLSAFAEPVATDQAGSLRAADAPRNLTAIAEGPARVALSWQAPVAAGRSVLSGYGIQFSEDGGATWSVLPTIGRRTTSFVHTVGLRSNASLLYRVFAIGADGAGPAAAATAVLPRTSVPRITAVRITANQGSDRWYPPRQELAVTVQFDQAVAVHTKYGTPRIALELGRPPHRQSGYASDYSGGTGTDQLTFRYTTTDWQLDLSDVEVGPNALDLNGGRIVNFRASHSALLAHAPATLDGVDQVDARSDAVLVLDTRAPARVPAAPKADLQIARNEQSGSPALAAMLSAAGALVAGTEIVQQLALAEEREVAEFATLEQVSGGQGSDILDSVETVAVDLGQGVGPRAAAIPESEIPGAPFLFISEHGQAQLDLSWNLTERDKDEKFNIDVVDYLIEVSEDGASWTNLIGYDTQNNDLYLPLATQPASTTYSHVGLEPGTTHHYRVKARTSNGVEGPWSTGRRDIRDSYATTRPIRPVPECAAAFWATEITVGSKTQFNQDGYWTNHYGSIADDDFSLGGTDYFVYNAWVADPSQSNPHYHFGVSPAFSDAEREDLTLYVGPVALPLGNTTTRTQQTGYYAYLWISTDYAETFGYPPVAGTSYPYDQFTEYSIGDKVTVCLVDATPRVTLTLDPASISENAETSTITASVSRASDTAFTVTVSAEPDDPAVDADFTLSTNKVLSFAANATESTGAVTITTVDNDVDAPNKTIQVKGELPGGVPVRAPADVTLTITDDDAAPQLSLSVSPATISEADTTVPAEVVVSTGTTTFSDDQTVTLTFDGTAVKGTDYTVSSETLSIGAGEHSVTAVVNAVNDDVDDDNETVLVSATHDGNGVGTQQTITITDNDEVPGAPGLTATAGDTQITLTWIVPIAGTHSITGYEYRRKSGSDDYPATWTPVTPSEQSASAVMVSNLTNGTEYTFTLRAVSDAGPGAAAEDSATPAVNTDPTINSAAAVDVAENTTAVVTVAASDTDAADDIESYELDGGADEALFEIGTSTGALSFRAAPNFEDAQDAVSTDPANDAGNNEYIVVVKANSGAGERAKSVTQTITVRVTDDLFEKPGKPHAPAVMTVTVSSVKVTWSAPDNPGPEIEDYDYQYREIKNPRGGDWTVVDDVTSTATEAMIEDLEEDTEYEVQVRASNDEGIGEWSESGDGATSENAHPTIDSVAAVDVAENTTAVLTVTASDADDSIESYEVFGGADELLFEIGASTGALSFKAAPNFEDAQDVASTDPANDAGNNEYIVVVEVTSGTGEREKSVTQTITVRVTNVDGETPSKPDEPTVTTVSVSKVTVSWSAPDNAGPAIEDYDYQYRERKDSRSGDWTVVADSTITDTEVTIEDLAEDTEYEVQVRAKSDEGIGNWSESGDGETSENADPTISSVAAVEVVENTTAVLTVMASDDDDSVTKYEVEGGADAALFEIGASTGALSFKAAPNFEDAQDVESTDPANAAGNNEYIVVVQATSGTGEREKSVTQTITVKVTDVDRELPSKPDAPTVTTVSVSKVRVSWSAPDNAGPDITDYDYQYRELQDPPSGDWTVVADTTITGTEVTIQELAEDTGYEVQVRATSDEGIGAWSDSGDGATNANAAPTISSDAAVDVAENTTAVLTVAASDTDDSIESYELDGGVDEALFEIGASTGALSFRAAPNFEDAQDAVSTDPANDAGNNEYIVVVQATSGTGEREKSVTQTITVRVTDVNGEMPGKPAAPTVAAVSVSKVKVSWSAPDNAGPAIEDYDYQYRELKDPRSGDWTVVADSTITDTEVTIEDLAEDTEYEVQVRAKSDDGPGDWSESGDGETSANADPTISSVAAVEVVENTTAVLTVMASDTDDSIESYEVVGGADELLFAIGESTGALSFKAAPNYEDAQDVESTTPANAAGNNEYIVMVRVTSGTGEREKYATQTITVSVTDDQFEEPGKPDAPAVTTVSVSRVTATWTAPDNAGPAITDYDYQYREIKDPPSGDWTVVADTAITGTEVTIQELAEDTQYEVQVRATSDEGTGDWSESGDGETSANAAPTIDSAAAADVAENTTAVLTVTASDTDAADDIESYELDGGVDEVLFEIGASTGALSFKAAPNFEDAQDVESTTPANDAGNNEYIVVVEVTSGTGEREKSVTQTITVTVRDVPGEKPGKPDAPTVTTVSVSKVKVTWSAPDNAGPEIEDYDYQYREIKDPRGGDWTVVDDSTITDTEVTIEELEEDTEYELQVRAKNGPTDIGEWSDSGDGETNSNAHPTITSAATADVAENTTAVVTVVASDTDAADDVESYAVSGGVDAALFEIGASTGVLSFKAAPNFEDAQDVESTTPANDADNNEYIVVVEVTSGTGEREKSVTQTITVTVRDVGGEKPGKPDAPTVATVSVSKVKVTWSAPDNAGPEIEDYDYQYRELKDPRSGDWTVVDGTAITGTEATIQELAEDTEYEVQVRATSAEGTGEWSDPGDGATSENAHPTISSDAAVDVAENTTAVLTVTASDSDTDDDIESYEVSGGVDQALFEIGASTGALSFKAAPNFEDAQDAVSTDPANDAGNNEYIVVVKANSGAGERAKSVTQTITVRVTDDNFEKPGKPDAPAVTTVSVSKVKVSWSAPDNAGPDITDYDYQYRELKDPPSGDWTVVADTTITDTEVTIEDLAEDTEYEVQVRAKSDEGIGNWSESGDGETSENADPTISSVAAVEVVENTTAVLTVMASDTDDSIESYEVVGGADELLFAIGESTGALSFKAAPNFEDAQDVESTTPANAAGNNEYIVMVRVTSGTGEREKYATQTITVTVTDDLFEKPGKPDAPAVTTVSVSRVTATWSAPDNAGPDITDYDYQYRELQDPPSGDWTVVADTTITGTEVTIQELAEDTGYEVQVRATSDEGIGAWSDSGDGATNANAAPTISSDAAVDVAENTTAVLTVAASDDDDSVTKYEVEGGADEALFEIGASTGALSFKAAPNFEDAQDVESTDPANSARNNEYIVVVKANSGTGERQKSVTQTITVTVTDVTGEMPGMPAAPTVTEVSVSKVKVSWSAPDNAGPAVEDYDYQYRELKDPRSGDWTVVADSTITDTEVTIEDLAEDTEYEVQVRAKSDEGIGNWSESGDGETSENADPTISSVAAVEVVENTTAVLTVAASDDDDSVTKYEVEGGADAALFEIGASTGALSFMAAPNFENAQDVESTDPANAAGNNEYIVVVQATSGAGEREKSVTQTITVRVTDDLFEKPGKPDAPAVTTVSVSKVKVSWSAPDNAGPDITDYDYQYRELKDPPSGDWTVVDDTAITVTEVTIEELAEDTEYEVQVRASTDEGTGEWSDSGEGETSANADPTISSDAAVDVAENTTAVLTVTASDSDTDDDIESYEVSGGVDQALFEIGASTGALSFRAAPNFEDAQDAVSTDPANDAGNNEYIVVVKANSGAGERAKSVTQTITVRVTDDLFEKPGKPDAPAVTTVSVSKVKVSWSAPDNAGPAIEDYDYQYRELKDPPSGDWTVVDDTTITGTEVTIQELAEDTGYEVQVRATSDEGTGAWSDSGDGATNANAAPTISSDAAVDVAENTTAVLTVTASDTDDSIESYELDGGVDEALFEIGTSTGALSFRAAPNFEDAQDAVSTDPANDAGNNEYIVVVKANSGAGERAKSVTQTITVRVTDYLFEKPGKPDAPAVTTVSVSKVTVSWSAPDNAGPAITDYDYQYRELKDPPSGDWTVVDDTTITGTEVTIQELAEDTGYEVQVRATSDEGTGDWSDSGDGATSANAEPTIDSAAAVEVAENTTAVLTVTASDTDDSIESYELDGGVDEALFEIGTSTGALSFKAAPNFEDAQDVASTDPANDAGNNEYIVVVKANSGAGERAKSVTQTITVRITDYNFEKPGKPDAPAVTTVSMSEVKVTWSAPDNPGPDITDYDYRYRELKTPRSGSWTVVDGTTTATEATIGNLKTGTGYEVQVLANSDEGTGDWSESGDGATRDNVVPRFISTATPSVAENAKLAVTLQATDDDGDTIVSFGITGGADSELFAIDDNSGLLFEIAPDFEDPKDAASTTPANDANNNQYVVVVTVTSGAGDRALTAQQTITVTVTDAEEPPLAPGAPQVDTVSITELRIRWLAPANTGPPITDNDYRYRIKTPRGLWLTVEDTEIQVFEQLITDLQENTEYEVQVRANNGEGVNGNGAWSESGSGETEANASPHFTSSATFEIAENSTGSVGTVTADDTDAEDNVDAYAIVGGKDEGLFEMDGNDALSFKNAPNFEAAQDGLSTTPPNAAGNNQYIVVVRAYSGTVDRLKSSNQIIVVTVTDVDEPPLTPDAPTVVPASPTSLTVTWSDKTDVNRPAATTYDYQYSVKDQDTWTEVTDYTATSVTITGLTRETDYEVQVQAKSDEGTSGWSDSGEGTTPVMPVVTLVLDPDSIAEGGVSTVTATVAPAADAAFAIEVSPAADSGNDADVFELSTNVTLQFAANETASTGTVTISAVDNAVDEDDKTVTVSGTVVAGAEVLVAAAQTLTITDDDVLATVTALESTQCDTDSDPSACVEEGNDALFPVTLTGGTTTAAVVIGYEVSSEDATVDVDYTAPSDGLLTIAMGESTGTITVETNGDDDILDPGETLKVTLTSGSTTAGGVQVSETAATMTIADTGEVNLSVADAEAAEGDVVNFAVKLTRKVASGVTFSYQTANETAESGTGKDYTAASGTLTFAADAKIMTVAVTTLEDALDESDETFTLKLTAPNLPTDVTLTDDVATGTIQDDDTRGVTVSTDAVTVVKGGDSESYTLRLRSQPTGDVTININGPGGGVLVSPTQMTFTPQNWSTTKSVQVSATTDAQADTTARITHSVSGADYAGQTANHVTVTIQEQTSVGLDLRPKSNTGTSGTAGATGDSGVYTEGETIPFFLKRTSSSQEKVTVMVTLRQDGDYMTGDIPTSVTLLPHEKEKDIPIPTEDDAIVEPDGSVTITIACDCAVTTGTLTVDVLNNDAEFAVDNAEAVESEGHITFTVEITGTLQVDMDLNYETTKGGSATAGKDYEKPDDSALVTVPAGKRTATISIPVLDDTLVEGDEWFGMRVFHTVDPDMDRSARGTIRDDDAAVAKAWLARFGRTVASHVVEAVDARLTGELGPTTQVTLGGTTLPSALAPIQPNAVAAMPHTSIEGGAFLAGSSFQVLASESGGESAGTGLTMWGRGAATGLQASDKVVSSLKGQVGTGTVGVDYDWGGILAGLAVAYSGGGADYKLAGDQGRADEAASWLISAHPYARAQILGDRLTAWGLLGYGLGQMTLAADAEDEESGISMMMGALGLRGVLSPETSRFGLTVKTDAFVTRMTAGEGGVVETGAHRARLLAEGTYRMDFGASGVLIPRLVTGVRYDFGDVETGFGAEMGGGVTYTYPAWGLTASGNLRVLLTHQDSGFEQWGGGGSLRVSPGAAGLGPSVAVNTSLGAPASGAQRLFTSGVALGSAPAAAAAPGAHIDAEMGYGLTVLDGGAMVTPYVGMAVAEKGARAFRLGGRLSVGPAFSLSVEGERREETAGAATHGVSVNGALRW